MAYYETMLVTTAKLEEEASNALVEKFKTLIEENGTMDSVEDWGKRRLAYPIDKQEEGIYTLFNFTSDENFPKELDRVYKITDGVLRTIIIAKTEEEIELAAQEKERKAKAKADADARRAKAIQDAEDRVNAAAQEKAAAAEKLAAEAEKPAAEVEKPSADETTDAEQKQEASE